MATQTPKPARFTSRWAMIFACMGMAVGTGNIWRFPMQVAQHGGGSFLIPWFLSLFLWSIPLLMVEMAIGQRCRKGPFGAFLSVLGPAWAWMGGFVCICSMMIMCYYAVVTAWTFKYVVYALGGTLNQVSNEQAILLFDNFRNDPSVLGYHLLVLAVAGFTVHRSARGIEMLNRILIPSLLLILIFGAINALFLVGSSNGIDFLLTVETERLADPEVWIAGLSQSAWSTGAGWGLMLAYAVYAREKEDPTKVPMATGLGNNGVELIIALMIFPAVFAVMGTAQAAAFVSSTSSKGGIAFQVAPMLFGKMTLGPVLNILFFVALASAALTSLVAMVELSTRFFMDFALTRRTALGLTLTICLLFGIPSAVNDQIFDNQDFVWGVGLILSGLFLCILVIRYGVAKFTRDFLHPNATKGKPGLGFRLLIYLILIEGIILLSWWLWKMKNAGLEVLVSCLIQWGFVIAILIFFRKPLTRRILREDSQTKPDGSVAK